MTFDIITIFPNIFDSYFKESILARAQKNKLIKINVHNLRKYGEGKHKVLDDKPYGGGIGMVMKVGPVFKAVTALNKSKIQNYKSRINPKFKIPKKAKVILFTPRGKMFDQKMAYKFSKLDQLIFICGRYEGIDNRISKIADVELSIGDYDLMGGEIPTMAVIETISRLIPGVIGKPPHLLKRCGGKPKLLDERIPKIRGRGGRGFIEYPQYTRPEIFSLKKGVNWRVPKDLVSGDHKKIREWRAKHGKIIERQNH